MSSSTTFPMGGGSGSGSATNITVGTTTVTGGGTNRVLYEDAAQKVAASSAFTMDGTQIESTLQTNISGPDATTNVEIGSVSNDANAGTGGTSVVIGNACSNAGNSATNIILGNSNTINATGTGNMVIGSSVTLNGVAGANNIVIGGAGVTISTTGSNLIAIGTQVAATTNTSTSLIVGPTATNTASNQAVFGGNGFAYSDVYFGEGVANTTAANWTLHGTGGSGADNAGGNLLLAAGQSTGAGAVASCRIQSTVVAGTSSTPQALVDTAIYASGWQQLQRGMIALNANYTNATAGFTNTNLSATVVSGRTYFFTCCLFFADSTAADGAQFDFNGGTAAATNFIAQAAAFNNVGGALVLTNGGVTALATAIQVTLALTTQTAIIIQGSFVPSGAGTFIVRAAQTAHSTGTLTVNRGSYLSMTDAIAV